MIYLLPVGDITTKFHVFVLFSFPSITSARLSLPLSPKNLFCFKSNTFLFIPLLYSDTVMLSESALHINKCIRCVSGRLKVYMCVQACMCMYVISLLAALRNNCPEPFLVPGNGMLLSPSTLHWKEMTFQRYGLPWLLKPDSAAMNGASSIWHLTFLPISVFIKSNLFFLRHFCFDLTSHSSRDRKWWRAADANLRILFFRPSALPSLKVPSTFFEKTFHIWQVGHRGGFPVLLVWV